MKRLLLLHLLASLITSAYSIPFSNIFFKNVFKEESAFKNSSKFKAYFDPEKILHELRESDKKNAPKLINNSNGTKTIIYKTNKFQKNITKKELLNLIKNPKSFNNEQSFIKDSFENLKKYGIKITFIKESEDFAAKWYPSEKILTINKNIIELGSLIFAEVLNHEMIHIAQSCKAGSINAYPNLIGLKVSLNIEKKYLLSKDIYKDITKLEKSLENEAYTYQSDLNMGKFLIKKYCN